MALPQPKKSKPLLTHYKRNWRYANYGSREMVNVNDRIVGLLTVTKILINWLSHALKKKIANDGAPLDASSDIQPIPICNQLRV